MANFNGKPQDLKEINELLIINTIRDLEVATRLEIVEATKLSQTTVRTLLKELIERGEVMIAGLLESSGGRRAERYQLNPNGKLILTLIIEETIVFVNVINRLNQMLYQKEYEISIGESITSIINVIDKALDIYPEVEAIGLSVPRITTKKGYLYGNLGSKKDESFMKQELEIKFQLPIIIEYDLNTVALGYHYTFHKDSSYDNLVYIHFTTLSVGSGIILNGQIVKGLGYAGELGKIPYRGSTINQLLQNSKDDEQYVDIVNYALYFITCFLNPNHLIMGGNNFKSYLLEDIKKVYEDKPSVPVTISYEDNHHYYGFIGLSQLVFNYLEQPKLLINKHM